MRQQHEVHISVLDTAPITQRSNARKALCNSVELAQVVDDLGYHRYWVPEHHGMSGVASAAPAVVVERVASVTRRIRVGAGGVMLPNHAPIVIAEQFGTLEAFHPGRIDLGLGRALGGPRDIADRVRSEHERTAKPFEDQVQELLELFDADNGDGRAAAVPAVGNRPEIWMLGSGDHTARIAGSLGLPFVAAHHLKPLNAVAAVRTYLRTFQPSSLYPAPRISISVAVLVAENDERAQWLAGSLRMKIAQRRLGRPIQLPSPETAEAHGYATSRDTDDELTNVIVGAAATVLPQLQALVDATGADELLIKTDLFDPVDRYRSYELLMNEEAHRLQRAGDIRHAPDISGST
ncbi:LLM class flavin-dependent oxidoreductase [Nocardia beijingensis]|uniref:LLM class flavin-dependent oxidoreductase n=1 Tax=Nocardia beijingensis TaxID=95162 RepID=UPI001894CF3C|nr:LLM class flavin-dependent oxidoreductase [Nocardia beijingensis]MBF6076620.1 LLM class flavin-dependent oxidoreductase [Nocardia beijingensis]